MKNIFFDSTYESAFIEQLPPEEVYQMLLEQEADAYLSSIEAHEL